MQDAPDVHLGAEQAALRRELLPHQLVSRLPRQHDCVRPADSNGGEMDSQYRSVLGAQPQRLPTLARL